MNKKLIAFTISGVKEFGNLTVNLLTTDQKTEYDKNIELICLTDEENDKPLYINKLNLIYGKNASGKTNFLNLIRFVDNLTSSVTTPTNFSFYNQDPNKKISVKSLFVINKIIYKQKVTFNIERTDDGKWLPKYLTNETLKYNKKSDYLTPNELIEEFLKKDYNFTEINYLKKIDKNIFEKILNSNWDGRKVNTFSLNVKLDQMENENVDEKRIDEIFNGNLQNIILPKQANHVFIGKKIINETKDIIKFVNVFDKQIKSIFYDEFRSGFEVVFKGGKNVFEKDLSNILSTGTERGILTLYFIKKTLEIGADLYIDEIEANFNHKLVNFIIELFLDINTNKKGSRLFASTHYLETLNCTKRRDGIFVVDKNNNNFDAIKLNEIEDEEVKKNKKRKDIKNSKLIKSIYSLDIDPGMKESIEFKELFNA